SAYSLSMSSLLVSLCYHLFFFFLFFFFTDTAPTEIYTLSLHDALPICDRVRRLGHRAVSRLALHGSHRAAPRGTHVRLRGAALGDRKSTRLNSSHVAISYAVFCLKKKKKK